jgi:hypothetical protein
MTRVCCQGSDSVLLKTQLADLLMLDFHRCLSDILACDFALTLRGYSQSMLWLGSSMNMADRQGTLHLAL